MGETIPIEELLRHAGWLRRLAAELVRDASAADDLVQETWVAALRRPPREGRAARSWLARVARNLARNARRGANRRVEHERRAYEERSSPGADSIAAEAEAQRRVAEAVTELEAPLREVIVLRWFRGLDSASIARELALPESTVRTRQQRALEELRARLDRSFGGDRAAWSALLMPFARRASGPMLATSAAWTTFLWIAAAGGAVVVLTIGGATWNQRRNDAAIARAEPRLPLVAPANEQDAPMVTTTPEPSRSPIERVADAAAHPIAAGVDEGIVLAGRVLVDGREPEWPVELEIDSVNWAKTNALRGIAVARPKGHPLRGGKRARRAPVQWLQLAPEQHGFFRFGKLPSDWHGHLTAKDLHFADGTSSIELDRPAPDLLLRLYWGPALTGRIVDATGKPVAMATIDLDLHWGDESSGGSDRKVALSLEDGRFRIPLDTDNDHASASLRIDGNELGHRLEEVPDFQLAAGRDVGDLVLEPTRTLEFRALDSEGRPIKGAFARVEGTSWLEYSEPTDEQGRAELDYVPEVGAQLRFAAFRYADHVETIEPDARPEVRLERLAVLDVRLTGATTSAAQVIVTGASRPFAWQAIDDSEVDVQCKLGAAAPSAQRLDGHQWGFSSTRDGHYVFVGLRPDSPFEIDVQDASGRSLAVRAASVAAGEWQRLEIALD